MASAPVSAWDQKELTRVPHALETCDRLCVLRLLLESGGEGPPRPVENKLVGGAGVLLSREIQALRELVKGLQARSAPSK